MPKVTGYPDTRPVAKKNQRKAGAGGSTHSSVGGEPDCRPPAAVRGPSHQVKAPKAPKRGKMKNLYGG